MLLSAFVVLQARGDHPLLPLRVVLDRDRGASFGSMAIAGSGSFGVFLFLTYYLQRTLGFSPISTGLAFLPMMAAVVASATTISTKILPRTGPRPLVPSGMALAGIAMLGLTRVGVDSSYAADVLPFLVTMGVGMGMIFAPSMATATGNVAPRDAGVASALVNTMQQVGGSIGVALLSTFSATAATNYVASQGVLLRQPSPRLRYTATRRPSGGLPGSSSPVPSSPACCCARALRSSTRPPRRSWLTEPPSGPGKGPRTGTVAAMVAVMRSCAHQGCAGVGGARLCVQLQRLRGNDLRELQLSRMLEPAGEPDLPCPDAGRHPSRESTRSRSVQGNTPQKASPGSPTRAPTRSGSWAPASGERCFAAGWKHPNRCSAFRCPLGPPTAETSVSGLSVLAGHLTAEARRLSSPGRLTDSEFTAIGTENSTAFALSATEGSTVSQVQAASFGPSAVAIGAVGDVTISDSLIHATIGITARPRRLRPALATVQRTRLLTSQEGLDVCNTTAVAEDVAIQISGGVGVNVEGSSRCSGAGSLFTGRNLTITGSGARNGGVGLQASANTTNPAVVLTDSILWELANAIRAQPLLGKTTTLHLGRLAEDPVTLALGGPGTLLSTDEGGQRRRSETPRPGPWRPPSLDPDSPAIDAGLAGPVLPGESTTDLEGAPQGPRMGTAMELPGGTSERSRAASLVPLVKPKAPVPDLTAPRLRGVRLRHGRHPHLEVLASEAGRIRLTLRGLPRGCRHVTGRCRIRTLATQTDPIRRGTNSIGLAGPMARALKRARSLQLTATDFAGNRSAPQSLRA